MPEESLLLDEVKRIARGFAKKEWNGEVTEFYGIQLYSTEGVIIHQVEGKLKTCQRVRTGEPKRSSDALIYDVDVVYIERLFKLWISVKDKEVVGYEIEKEKPSPAPPPPLGEQPVEPIEPLSPRDFICRHKNKTDSMLKKYGIDEKKLGL